MINTPKAWVLPGVGSDGSYRSSPNAVGSLNKKFEVNSSFPIIVLKMLFVKLSKFSLGIFILHPATTNTRTSASVVKNAYLTLYHKFFIY